MRRRPAHPAARLDPEVRRAQLLAAATRAVAGHDPSDLSFDAIARAAGVSRSLLYAYFGDRGGLVAALYEDHLCRLDHDLGPALVALPNQPGVRRLVRRCLTFARDHPESWHVITTAGAVQHPAVAAVRRARVERIAGGWGEATETLVVRGVLGLLEAACQEWVEERPCGLERATRAITAALWDGLATRAEPAVQPVAG